MTPLEELCAGSSVTPLEELCAGRVGLAVDVAVHTADPKRFHKRYPKGSCPHCSLVKNLLAAQDVDLATQAACLLEGFKAALSTYQGDDAYHAQRD